jgi:hypothetical protein
MFITSVKYLIINPTSSAEQQHSNWIDTITAKGWTYNQTLNSELMTNPYLIEYDELDAREHVRYSVFIAIVKSLTEQGH